MRHHLAGILLSTTLFANASAQTITPEPIKLPPSEFPAPRSQLDALVAANDTTALRLHGWTLWAGVTADSSQSFNGQVLPIFETWLSEEEVFSSKLATFLAGRERNLRPLAVPSQFQAPKARTTADLRSRLRASVKLSPDAVGFLAAQQETPAGSGQSYSYKSASDFAQLNAFFDKHKTPAAERKIADFPAAATNLKLVWGTVKSAGLTGLPIWGGPQNSTNPDFPTEPTWKIRVAVDPTNSQRGRAKDIACNNRKVEADIVPIKAFYHIRLDANSAATANRILGLKAADRVAAGDYSILLAMHITTKEIVNWTWQTYWWQNGTNPPNNFPGGVDGMPDTIKGPWRSYAMCISDSVTVPFNDPKGKLVNCFNPYLETAFGTASNCMACHARANANVGFSFYTETAFFDPTSTIFRNKTRTDFVWAIKNSLPK